MSIEFHCEHCNHLIRAPDEAGGKTGRCPHCQSPNYIPRPADESGEIPLAPLNDEMERHREKEAAEATNLQYKLLREHATPGEPGKPGGVRGAGRSATSSPRSSVVTQADTDANSSRRLTTQIAAYVDAMSQGKLDEAESIADKLKPSRAQVATLLDEMAGGDLSSYGFGPIPKPVLQGFLKQMRARLFPA